MAHDVKLGLWLSTAPTATSPSVTTVDTTATGYDLEDLPLQTPIGDPLTEHVVETMTVRITGTSKADLRTKLSAVYDFADQVRRYWKGENAYLGKVMLQVENTGNAYWSLLYNVQVSHDNILGATLANYQAVVTITYERDGFWELVSLNGTGLTLTNPNGTATALNIANCNDGTGVSPNKLVNYVDIDTSDVDGDVPTPALIAIGNTENVLSNKRIYIGGIGVSSSGMLPTLFLEGETATGGTNTADATCSAGSKEAVALASGSEALMLTWALSGTVDLTLGMWYKVIARFADATGLGDVTFRWKIASGTTTVWEGPQFKVEYSTSLINELGEIPLPPLQNWDGALNLKLYGQQSTGASITLNLDYIQLMAVQTAIKAEGLVTQAYNETLYIPRPNAISDEIVRRVLTAGYLYDWYALWNPVLMLNPGQYYRIHFVIQSSTVGTAEIGRNSGISIAYRPRYRSIGE